MAKFYFEQSANNCWRMAGSSEDGNWDKTMSAIGRGWATWQKGLSRICLTGTNCRVEEGSGGRRGSRINRSSSTAFLKKSSTWGNVIFRKREGARKKKIGSAKIQESQRETWGWNKVLERAGDSGQRPQVHLPKSTWQQRPALKDRLMQRP